jgi:AcrR family transcriptional regulator
VARTPDLASRQELLDRVIDYLAEHGLGDSTLRPMAAALGTTPNRLMHHFGSKEALLAAALHRTEQRHRQIEARWVASRPTITQSELLRRWWRWMLASRTNLSQVRLGLEAVTLDATITGLAGEVRSDQIGAWRVNIERRLLAAGMPADEARTEASLLKATFTGLTLDLLATGDRTRLTRSLERALERFDQRMDDLDAIPGTTVP